MNEKNILNHIFANISNCDLHLTSIVLLYIYSFEEIISNNNIFCKYRTRFGIKDGIYEETNIHCEKPLMKCVYVDGKIDGLCELWEYDEHNMLVLIVKEYYLHGKKQGLCEVWNEISKLYERCDYVDGIKDGIYERWYYDKDQFLEIRITYKKGNYDGLLERWRSKNQLWYRYFFKNGKQDGICEEWHSNGSLKLRYKTKTTNNEDTYDAYGVIISHKDGLYEEWNENGILICKRHYINNHLDGLCETWNNNGVLVSYAIYKNGNIDGYYVELFENGNISKKVLYNNGDSQKEEEWYINGRQKSIKTLKKCFVYDGVQKFWSYDGILEKRVWYKNNKLHGVCEEWYQNRVCKMKTKYINGKIKMKEIWNDKGIITSRKQNDNICDYFEDELTLI